MYKLHKHDPTFTNLMRYAHTICSACTTNEHHCGKSAKVLKQQGCGVLVRIWAQGPVVQILAQKPDADHLDVTGAVLHVQICAFTLPSIPIRFAGAALDSGAMPLWHHATDVVYKTA